MNVAGSAVVALLNNRLITYGGDLAVGANGIVNSFAPLVLMVFLGICQGMQPIAGYNYGAGRMDRLKEVYRLTMKWDLIFGFIGMLMVLTIPRYIAMAFTNDAELIDMAAPALRLLMVMSPFIAFTVTNSQFFQSIDKPWIAIVTSLSRQVIFLIPMLVFAPPLFASWGFNGPMAVFFCCTVCDFLGASLSAVLLFSQRKVFRPGYVPPERRPKKEHGPNNSRTLES